MQSINNLFQMLQIFSVNANVTALNLNFQANQLANVS